MYKLVCVAGKLRGQEYTLKNGDNVLGRDESCEIIFALDGVSKRHVTFSVTDDVVYIQDLGSANGTFLNNKPVKRAALKATDKIGLPNGILQVVKVQEKKIVVKKKVPSQRERDREREEQNEDFANGGESPDNLVGKIFWFFKYKFMQSVYGINQEYEWRVLVAIITAVFAIATITLTIFPVLQDSRAVLITEVANRGAHFAEEIGRINATALEQRNLERLDTAFLDTEEGVV
jgi:hypothetical protein